MLPQFTAALRVSRNYSKVAYLKRLKSRRLNVRSDTVKQASIVGMFSKDGPFVFSLK